ncbi:beta strand repeat-containing protein [Methylocella sp.]|uniref:beta strand repeat-containing protein n=1 Tax=Methylocella sp. TaxID=1978226 RepID=UPI003784D1BB
MPRNVAGLGSALLASTALTAAASPALAQALPTGANVVSGSVALSTPNAQSLVVRQGSPTAIVNWQGFSIGEAGSVTFQQPSATAAILNRVTGSAPSTLAGRLDANGQVFLVNPNGIAITATGVVSAAGFVASTLAITDEDFRKGKYAFRGSGASAEVSNAGTINIGRGGYAALIGGTVSNAGVIEAPLGRVGFGSGEMATLDLSGDGFLQVAMPTKSGGDKALIRHSGTIRANGGRVVMTAATAREAARNAVNLSGVVQARSVSGRSGAIVIGGGPGGAVNVSGRLSVSGGRTHAGGAIAISGRAVAVSGRLDASGARGGAIALSGESVRLSGRAAARGFAQGGGLVTLSGDVLEILGAVDVSGASGGGAITVAAQKSATAGAAARLKADATDAGNGGAVSIVSKGVASVKGALSARGGAQGGDGGFIETSGTSVDFLTAKIDAAAPKGAAGNWLIDPTDLMIGTAEAAAISSGLATANVTVATPAAGSQAGDIAVAAPISWASANRLTLDAANAVTIDAPITISGAGKLSLIAAFDPAVAGLPLISFGEGASVQYTGAPNAGQALSVNGQAYALLYSMADLAGVNANLSGAYALARPVDAGGASHGRALIAPGYAAQFNGKFEGLGNSVARFSVATTENYFHAGLFGYVGGQGVVTHLGVVDGAAATTEDVAVAGGLAGYNGGVISQSWSSMDVTGGIWGAGSLVGQNAGSIVDSHASGAALGSRTVGGLVGENDGLIARSHASGTATGSDVGSFYVGGLVGTNQSGTITDSYATGAATAYSEVGGLVGATFRGAIARSYATGAVTGAPSLPTYVTTDVGGFVGSNFHTRISQSHASGPVSAGAGANRVGGFAGLNYDETISQSYATGSVTAGEGARQVGGFVGANIGGSNGTTQHSVVTQSYASGAVSAGPGSRQVGGFVGANFGSAAGAPVGLSVVSQSYATGAVTVAPGAGGDAVGGFAGSNGLVDTNGDAYFGFISQAYATGAVGRGVAATAGFTGRNMGAVTQSYWDKTTTGQIGGVAVNAGTFDANGLSTDAFFKTASFAGWTFGTTPGASGWVIVDNGGTLNNAGGQAGGTRPMLLSEYATDIVNLHQLQLAALAPAAAYALKADLDFGAAQTDRSDMWRTAAGAPWFGYGFVPIGTWAPQFTGTFDGGGHKISNLGIYRPFTSNVGLFGYVGVGGVVKNIELAVASVTGYDRVGALVGTNAGLVENASASASVMGQFHTGALVGWNSGSIVNAASLSGAVSSPSASSTPVGEVDLGGLVGRNDGAIRQSHAAATVSYGRDLNGAVGPWRFGGLAGTNTGLIEGSDASGAVDVTPEAIGYDAGATPFMAGGLVGRNDGVVRDSSATGGVFFYVVADPAAAANVSVAAGGLAGFNAGSILRSHADGATWAKASRSCCQAPFVASGGLVGINAASGLISQSYATGGAAAMAVKTTGLDLTSPHASGGGLVGENYGAIERAYALGPASATAVNLNDFFWPVVPGAHLAQADAGGLVGYNSGSILNSYARAQATAYVDTAVGGNPATSARPVAGGLIGRNSGVVEAVYAAGVVSSTIAYFADGAAGGLVGSNTGSVSTAYWDVEATTQAAGFWANTGQFSAAGLTTQQLKAALPQGFDPAVWSIVPGVTYPFLKPAP